MKRREKKKCNNLYFTYLKIQSKILTSDQLVPIHQSYVTHTKNTFIIINVIGI